MMTHDQKKAVADAVQLANAGLITQNEAVNRIYYQVEIALENSNDDMAAEVLGACIRKRPELDGRINNSTSISNLFNDPNWHPEKPKGAGEMIQAIATGINDAMKRNDGGMLK